ncbi:MAG: M1 family metallopeptidase [Chitinophagaceae bacterium]|nr:M1 family metallopeptidase [Chitinophagaceae bacterium]
MKKGFLLITIVSLFVSTSFAQYWQQRVKYTMNIDMNVQTNRFAGKQKLEYWNNSPDTLTKVFYHLYFNAFQPGSMMDERSRRQGTVSIAGIGQDWDIRVADRIQKMKPDEIGYQKILSLTLHGKSQQFTVHETILEVKLDKPIPPKSKAVFDMDFEAQVPLQIRRSGRDNAETQVRYSMSQWYPKICEYDNEGWHPVPYVGREFYGVWGDFDVSISIDKKYILGGTGYLQNANQIGYGYETAGTKVNRPAGNKLTWRFLAPNVHDFAWAADPDFIHKTKTIRDSLTIHVLYKTTTASASDWEKLITNAEKAFPFIEKTFGAYLYKQFSFIQGGDGGMEYPMITLLTGPGAWLHELLHNWYYGMLATNESLYPWMDEGLTQYAGHRVQLYMNGYPDFISAEDYASYFQTVKSGKEEPLVTQADHYNTNFAYGSAVYSKGSVFFEQLGYVVGTQARDRILMEYYRQWKFKHPAVNDFIRVAEKVSDMKLDWYKEYWVNTTRTIDYSIDSLWEESGRTKIRLGKTGIMPMPTDVVLTFKDGSKEMHYIPMSLMYGTKPAEDSLLSRKVYEPWKWTHPFYIIETTKRLTDFSIVEIDPSMRMADVERRNNKLVLKW